MSSSSVSAGRWSVLLPLLLLGGCAGEGPGEPPPDLFLVTIDTLRADHVGCYGYERPTTPELDALAAEGVRFEAAYAPTGATCPSHATLFTGRGPLAHGLVRNGLPLVADEVTLAERLREAGYRTAAFVSSYPLKGFLGFDQGFEHYEDEFPRDRSTFRAEAWEGLEVADGFSRPAEDTVRGLRAWLEESEAAAGEAPLFVWLHLFDPHEPYLPPPGHDRLFATGEMKGRERVVARYDEEIRYADLWLGRALEALLERRPGREPLVCVASDHGEGLRDHGWPTHNKTLYEEEVRVPLVLRRRGDLPAGRVVREPVHLVDLAGTLLALLGLAEPGAPWGEGLDLSGPARGGAPAPPERDLLLLRPVYPGGRPELDPEERGLEVGLRRGSWKYLEAREEGRFELYDLARDPGERENRFEAEPERARELAGRLARRVASFLEAGREGGLVEDERVREALEALGYAGGGGD